MISIGDIQDKLNKSVFGKDIDPLNSYKYLTRELTLKKCLIRAFEAIKQHIHEPDDDNLEFWQKDRIDRNIKNYTKYIERLYLDLDKQKIIEYCDNHDSVTPITFEDDEFLFMVNSYYGSIVLDVLWAHDISVSDVIEISKGNVDIENLAKRIPDKIKHIKNEIIPYLNKSDSYNKYTKSIMESIDSYEKGIYLGANLLIMVAIEGLVRKLGSKLIDWQELDNSYKTKMHNALDSYLRKIPWKSDFKIERSRLMFITGDFIFHEDRPEEKHVFVNLKTRLDFLRRIFKVDRDLIIHGDKTDYGEIWDLYRNFSALNQVYLTLTYYDDIYK